MIKFSYLKLTFVFVGLGLNSKLFTFSYQSVGCYRPKYQSWLAVLILMIGNMNQIHKNVDVNKGMLRG